MKTKIFLATLLLCIFFSCKKSDSNGSCDKTVASIAGTYEIVKFEAGFNGIFQDFTNQIDACDLDNKILLKADGTTVTQDVGAVCTPLSNSTGTWSISSAGKITINDNNGGPTDISTADITSYDCATLVLTGADPTAPSDQFRLLGVG